MRELILYEKNGDNAIYRNQKGNYYKILRLDYDNEKEDFFVTFEPFTYKIKDYFFVKSIDDFLGIRIIDGKEEYKFIHISELKTKEEQIKYKNELFEIVQLKSQKSNFKNPQI